VRDAVAAPKPLGAVARHEAERGDRDVDDAGFPPPAAGMPRHRESHPATDRIGTVLVQLG
jgi:hypothetical protein